MRSFTMKKKKAKSKISAKRARVRKQASIEVYSELGEIAVPAAKKARTPRQYATELYKLNRQYFDQVYQEKVAILEKPELKRFQKQYPNVREFVVKRVLADLKERVGEWISIGKRVKSGALADFQIGFESSIINVFPQPEVSSALWLYQQIKRSSEAEQELKLLSLDDKIVANRFKYIKNHVWNYTGAAGAIIEISIPFKSSPIQFNMVKKV